MRSTLASRSPSPRVGGSVDRRRRRGIRAAEPETDAPSTSQSQPQPQPSSSSSSSPPPPSPSSPPPVTSPTDLVAWGGRLPSRRRLLISGVASTSIVLAGNFGGATSLLLSSTDAAAALARSLRLDVLFPVRGYKRALAPDGGGYEFVYPRAWLADQTVARRRAVAAELSRPLLDGPQPSAAALEARRRRASSSRAAPPGPEVAFGPAGSSGETNVSVIVAPIEPGFSLRQLGTPEEAGREFLETTVAKPGSGRTAELLRAEERYDDNGGGGGGDDFDGETGETRKKGVLYYEFEYRVRGPQFDRLNCSAFAGREGSEGGGGGGGAGAGGGGRRSAVSAAAAVGPELVTLNAQAPWEDVQRDPKLAQALRECARSLKVGKRAPGVKFGAGARPF